MCTLHMRRYTIKTSFEITHFTKIEQNRIEYSRSTRVDREMFLPFIPSFKRVLLNFGVKGIQYPNPQYGLESCLVSFKSM